MRSAVLGLLLFGCDAGGTPCQGDMVSLCGRAGMHCVPSWSQASDPGTWCAARDITNARTALQTCLGYHVAVATVGTTNPPSTVWYYYEPNDGGLVGAATRDDQFVMHCLGGEQTFRVPDDCASSDSPHCCRLDFGPELSCSKDAAAPTVKDASSD